MSNSAKKRAPQTRLLQTRVRSICSKRLAFVQAGFDAMLDASSPEYARFVAELRGADEQQILELIERSARNNPIKTYQARKRLETQQRLEENVRSDGAEAQSGADAVNEEVDVESRVARVVPAASSRPVPFSITERTPGMFCSAKRYRSVSFMDMQQAQLERDLKNGLRSGVVMDVYSQYSTGAARDLVAAAVLCYLPNCPSDDAQTSALYERTVVEANQFMAVRGLLLWTVMANMAERVRVGGDCRKLAGANESVVGEPVSTLTTQLTTTLQLDLHRDTLHLRILQLLAIGCTAVVERWVTAIAPENPPAKGSSCATRWAEYLAEDGTATLSGADCAIPENVTNGKQCSLCSRTFRLVAAVERIAGTLETPRPDDAWPCMLSVAATPCRHQDRATIPDMAAHGCTLLRVPVCNACASGVSAYSNLTNVVQRCRGLAVKHLRDTASAPSESSPLTARLNSSAMMRARAFLHTPEFMDDATVHLHETLNMLHVFYARYMVPRITPAMLTPLRRAIGDEMLLAGKTNVRDTRQLVMHLEHRDGSHELTRLELPFVSDSESMLVRADQFVRESATSISTLSYGTERLLRHTVGVDVYTRCGVAQTYSEDTARYELVRHLRGLTSRVLDTLCLCSPRIADIVCAPRTKRTLDEAQCSDEPGGGDEPARPTKRRKKSAFRLHAGGAKKKKPQQIVAM